VLCRGTPNGQCVFVCFLSTRSQPDWLMKFHVTCMNAGGSPRPTGGPNGTFYTSTTVNTEKKGLAQLPLARREFSARSIGEGWVVSAKRERAWTDGDVPAEHRAPEQ
jgi:hypothetical protein